MINRNMTLSDLFTIVSGVIGALMVIGGTFLEAGRLSFMGYFYIIRFSDLGLDSILMTVRIICLIAIATLFIPKVPKVSYSACVIVLFALYGSKLTKGWSYYIKAMDFIRALGLGNIVDLSKYIKASYGVYLIIAGAVIMSIVAVRYLVLFFMKERTEVEE